MLRSHHHLRGFVKLVLRNVYCVNGCGSSRLGYVGIGFEGNCDCGYGILYAPMLGGGFCGFWLIWHLLLILRTFLVPGGGWFASRVLLCVRVRRFHAFGFFLVDYSVLYFTTWERRNVERNWDHYLLPCPKPSAFFTLSITTVFFSFTTNRLRL